MAQLFTASRSICPRLPSWPELAPLLGGFVQSLFCPGATGGDHFSRIVRAATDAAQNTDMTRRWELDALRGLMLVLMTLTHLPTRLSSPLGQPFGFVSAAEGFVLLSA